MRQAIRNLSSDKPTPPRFCDVVIDGDEVQLEVKTDKNKYETISWEDIPGKCRDQEGGKEINRNYRK